MFTIAVSFLPPRFDGPRTQVMAGNYSGQQSQVQNLDQRTFQVAQVADRHWQTGNGWHGLAAHESRVLLPVTDTAAGLKRLTQNLNCGKQ